METLKVALASDWFHPKVGGIETHIHELALKLLERGHEPHVITHDYRVLAPYTDPFPYPVHRFSAFVYFKESHISLGPSLLWQANELYKRVGFDVTHVHSIYSPLSIAIANLSRGIRGVPVVATNHSFFGKPRLGFLIQRLIRHYTRRVDVFIAVSRPVAEDTRRVLGEGLNGRPVYTIPNAVDPGFWRPPTDYERLRARRELGLDEEVVAVAVVGRLTKRKGFHKVPDILGRAKRLAGRDKISLVIAGDGPLKPLIVEEIARNGLDGSSKLLGFMPRAKLRSVYWAADALLVPGPLEALPITSLEAMSCGLPIIAWRGSGLADAVLDGETGFLVRSLEEFAERLALLAGDEDLRRRLGGRARRRVLEEFSWDRVLERILEAYRVAMDRAAGDDKRYLLYRLWRRVKG